MIEIDDGLMKDLLKKGRDISKKENPIENINLFSILGMENKEVTAHSAFLYYIFKPFYKDEDTIDDKNLRILYKQLMKKDPSNLQYISIQREVSFSGGRMDFLINYADESGIDDAIIIELKIWAGEQENQIPRYKVYLIDNGYSEENIFFLTPIKRESTTDRSTKNITLKEDICNVLNDICNVRKKENADSYITIINQYIKIIEKITKGDDEIMNENIITSAEDIKAVDQLFLNRTQALNKLLTVFMQDLKQKFDNKLSKKYDESIINKLEFINENCSEEYLEGYFKRGISCYPALIYKLPKEWLKTDIKVTLDKESEKLKKDYCPCFFIEIDDRIFAGFSIRDTNIRYFSIDTIKNHLKELGSGKITQWFMGWEWVKSNGKRIDFSNFYNEESFLNLLSKNELTFQESSIESCAECTISIFNTFFKMFFEINEN